MNFSFKTMEEVGKYYFQNSLQYFPDKYIPLLLQPDSVVPRHVGYLCPLCLQQALMIIDAPLQRLTAEFTEDHYPPKSVGGNKKVLVCRSCNSQAGHTYDHALIDHLKHLGFERKVPNAEIKTKSVIPSVGKFAGRMLIDEKGEVRVDLKKDEGMKIKPLDEWIEYSKKNEDWKIHLHFNSPPDEKVEKALIHAAYLTCFEYFGYEYLFSEGGKLMRKVLNDGERYPANVLDLNLDSEDMIQQMPTGLVFIILPEQLQSMAVNLKLRDKTTHYTTIKTILIPNPSATGIDHMKHVSDQLVNHVGGISMTSLKNFLQEGVLPPYRSMWAVLLRDYIDRGNSAEIQT